MTTLAFEFSSDQRSVACACDGNVLAEVKETGGRSTKAMSMIQAVLKQTSISRDQVEEIIVGLGPGSYTGIRTGIAVAEGWHLMTGAKLKGISSVQCLAKQAQREKIFGQVDIVIDAQRGEIYHSRWAVSAGECAELTPLKIYPANELPSVLAPEGILAGPEALNWDGKSKIVFPSAAVLCELAAKEKKSLTDFALEPIYLRETSFIKAPPSRLY